MLRGSLAPRGAALVTEEEFARHRGNWKPPRKPRMTALAKYAALVTSADTGAVVDRDKLD